MAPDGSAGPRPWVGGLAVLGGEVAGLGGGIDRAAAALTAGWRGPAATACEVHVRVGRAALAAVEAALDSAVLVLRQVAARGGGPTARDRLELLAAQVRSAGAALAATCGTALEAGLVVPSDPAAARNWWSALPPRARQALLLGVPSVLGDAVGLPLDVRGAANERVLAADLQHLEALALRQPLSVAQARRLMTARVTAEQLTRVRGSREPRTGQLRSATLIGYDAAFSGSEGRAVLVVGDPQTADNVAVLVPGLGADVSGDLESLTGDALRLADAAAADAPGESTAVVAWLGYDAPELATVASALPAVLGAARLDRDLRGVAAARTRPAHVTLVGHSYGSTVVGTAARAGAPLDDMVLMGSPGTGAQRAADLAAAEHVFVAAASTDPVSYLGWFGRDPAQEGFGGVRLAAEPAERRGWLDPATHSGYLAAGSESLHGVSHVVVGDLDEVRPATPRPGLPLVDPERRRPSGEYGWTAVGRDAAIR